MSLANKLNKCFHTLAIKTFLKVDLSHLNSIVITLIYKVMATLSHGDPTHLII